MGGARRRLLAPEPVDQPVGRDRAVGLEPEHRQHRALLRSAERDRAVVDAGLEVAEDAELHARDQPNHLLDGRTTADGRGCAACRAVVYGRSTRFGLRRREPVQNRRRPGRCSGGALPTGQEATMSTQKPPHSAPNHRVRAGRLRDDQRGRRERATAGHSQSRRPRRRGGAAAPLTPPTRSRHKSSPSASARSWRASKRSPSYHEALREAATVVKPAAARAGPRRRRHRLGRRRHRRREPARRDRARARGRRDDPASQAPGGPGGDCRLTPRTKDRRERGADTSPAPRLVDQATARRSRPAPPHVARRHRARPGTRRARSRARARSVTAPGSGTRRRAAPLTRESRSPLHAEQAVAHGRGGGARRRAIRAGPAAAFVKSSGDALTVGRARRGHRDLPGRAGRTATRRAWRPASGRMAVRLGRAR